MKYVMLLATYGTSEKKVPFLFPDFLVHSIVASYAKNVLLDHKADRVKVVSAGEYDLVDGTCSGKSDTLRLDSHPDDGAVISTYNYTHGML